MAEVWLKHMPQTQVSSRENRAFLVLLSQFHTAARATTAKPGTARTWPTTPATVLSHAR